MKRINKWIGILYLLISISIALLTFSGANVVFVVLSRIHTYLCIIACGLGVLVGLANFIKKEAVCGIFCIIGAIAFAGYVFFNIPIVVVAESAMMFLSGIFILVLKKNYEDNGTNGTVVFFCILLLILILSVTIYQSILAIQNILSLKKAVSNITQNENQETYIYKATTGETVFLNIDGEEINRRLFDDFDYRNTDNGFKYDLKLKNGNQINLSDAIIGGKTHFIDSTGNTIFTINNGFYDHSGELFINYVLKNKICGIEKSDEDVHKNIYATFYERITDSNKNDYEDKCDFVVYEDKLENNEEYIYFRNNELVIQVVNTIDLSDDSTIKDAYSEFNKNNAEYYDRNSEKIDEYYRTKKIYYFINLNNHRKTKINCNNMIYEALNDGSERILAYKNRFVPYYDNDKVGYVDANGKVLELDNDCVIRSVNDKYVLIYEKSTEKNYVYSTNTMDELKEMSRLIYTYDSIVVSYSLSDIKGIQLLDQDYEYVDTFYNTPDLVGHHIIAYPGGNSYLSQVYFYNDGIVAKIDDVANQFISANSMHYKSTGNHIFESIGIIR